MAIYFLTQSHIDIRWEEKAVIGTFFAGAIICLGMSFAFHTVHCHSECVGKLFSKLDYCGIAMLIMGSFVPWLYYGFYCDFQPKVIYLSIVIVLGMTSIVVSLDERFSEPKYRFLRAGVFAGFGLSGVSYFFKNNNYFFICIEFHFQNNKIIVGDTSCTLCFGRRLVQCCKPSFTGMANLDGMPVHIRRSILCLTSS